MVVGGLVAGGVCGGGGGAQSTGGVWISLGVLHTVCSTCSPTTGGATFEVGVQLVLPPVYSHVHPRTWCLVNLEPSPSDQARDTRLSRLAKNVTCIT